MSRSSYRLAALVTTCLLGMAACDKPTATAPTAPAGPAGPAIGAPTPNLFHQTPLGVEIQKTIIGGYPKGQAAAVLARWDVVLLAVAADRLVMLRGKRVPASLARQALTLIVTFIQRTTSTATPPGGETQAHFVARLVLDMSLYVYGGASTPVPSVPPTSDVAFKLVQPGVADTVVTPAKRAAVAFPSTSLVEPTIVVITPDTSYYPDNCSGPLGTHLCQYPRFYHFNVFPDVKLNTPAKVQVCHVDAGNVRRPLADHDRFRIAHDKPADPADYVAGGTIVDNIEVLPLTPMFVTDCLADGGTTYLASLGAHASLTDRAVYAAHLLAHRAEMVASALVSPSSAYAIDVGGGGFVNSFSNFAVVDPQSTPDLAQSTARGAQFSPAAASGAIGAPLPLNSWSVTNVGSGTSGPFTSNLIVATDSALTSVVATVPLGGAPSLVPGASYSYPVQTITLPATAGTYFVGTRLVYTGTDSTASDDWTSARVSVGGEQHAGSAPWTGAGPGVVTETVTPTNVTLHYDHTPSSLNEEQWTFTTTAVATGNYTFNWTYNGLHSWYESHQALQAFADGPNGEVVQTLVQLNYVNTGNGFGFSGTATLPLTAGYAWGVRPSGGHFDSSLIMNGTVQIMDPAIIP